MEMQAFNAQCKYVLIQLCKSCIGHLFIFACKLSGIAPEVVRR